MNIFNTIAKSTKRIEKYHSQFLADALEYSLYGNRGLFDALWNRVAPHWETPNHATVLTEVGLESGRIDICIRVDKPRRRVVGIEIKTREHSAKLGQLEKYYYILRQHFPDYDVQISYLTPFNEDRAGKMANQLPTVREFKRFESGHPNARHVSWLDVAEIPWESNDLWKQHQVYVRKHISPCEKLRMELNRGFVDFFNEELTERFRDELLTLGIHLTEGRTEIKMKELDFRPAFIAKQLTKAIESLVESENVISGVIKRDKFSAKNRDRFLASTFSEVHKALFELAERYSFLWLEGEGNYGVKIAHIVPKNRELSLITSLSTDRFETGRHR